MTTPDFPAGLMLIHGNRPEDLRDLLVQWISCHPPAPLEREIILVQSNGIAQWLKLALAEDASDDGGGGCGIAAALEFSLPSRFLWQVYRTLLGRDAVPETSPFDKSRLIWRLMRLLPALVLKPLYAPLRRFLENDSDCRKRFQLAERLADLFDQYQVYRADWLEAWAAGEGVLIKARGGRVALPDEQRWQADLWSALLADVDRAVSRGSPSHAGRAAVHAAFLQRAAQAPEGERPAGLPRRIIVFGISSLPRQSLEVLGALARWTQVLMCVHNPCEHYWADIVPDQDLLRGESARQQRRNGMPRILTEAMLHQHAHPLLAAWGKQGRDFIALLDEYDSEQERARYQPHFSALQQRINLFSSPGETTLLQQLQDDIRDLRPLGETREHWPPLDPVRDGSLRFHSAHSPQREVEILHDQLLAAFNADSTLRPRDVIVMVPEIDAYVPHIQAVFGLLEAQDPRYIPFCLADQGRRHHDPLLNALEKLIGLPQSRLAVSDVLDLLDVPALRARFGIAPDDLPLLQRWIRGANIRWGLHAEQRSRLGLPAQAAQLSQNTWLFGLRRMLLGYAAGAHAGPWRGIEAYDEVGGLDAALLGPLWQLLERLEVAWRTLSEPATVAVWCERLRALLADFFAADDSGDAYTLLQLGSALDLWQEACAEAELLEPLPLSVVGEYWLSQLDEGGLSQRFFAGAVTFATLMPMRAIPFRQVCLLGMNDGDYPRSRVPLDFDLMGGDYRPGDRSRREDDRYLFLEALLSARERLHISWVGRSINDNSPRPPSVLVGQLRDHLAAGWRLADYPPGRAGAGEALLSALTLEHRLQPFSPDYFSRQPEAAPLFTYAHEWRSMAADELPQQAHGPLPPLRREEPLSLRDLGEFLKDPVKAFFRQRLNVQFELDDVASADQEPFNPDGLERWRLQEELIRAQAQALAEGEEIMAAREAGLACIQRRGELACGGFGEITAGELVAPMDDLFARYQEALSRWPRALAGEVEIRHQATVQGQLVEIADWLGDLRGDAEGRRGRVLLEASDLVKNNHYRGERLIRHWLTHLAAHLVGEPLTTVVVSKVGQVELPALAEAEARQYLDALLAAWHEGMRRPLPLAAKTAFAWLNQMPERQSPEPAGYAGEEGAAGGKAPERAPETLDKAIGAARTAYEGSPQQPGELCCSPYLQRAYPSFPALYGDGEFVRWAETLLRPLQRVMFAGTDKAAKPGEKAGSAA